MERRLLRLVPAAALCAALVISVPAAGGAVSTTGSDSGEATAAAAKKKCKKKGKRGKKGKKRKCKRPAAPLPTPIAQFAKVAINPASYDFGLVDALYTPRHERRFTVTNNGNIPTGALGIALGGDDPEDYEINDDGCSGAALGAGASCTFDVAFVPPPSGEFDCDATVTVTGTPGGSVSGTVTADGFV